MDSSGSIIVIIAIWRETHLSRLTTPSKLLRMYNPQKLNPHFKSRCFEHFDFVAVHRCPPILLMITVAPLLRYVPPCPQADIWLLPTAVRFDRGVALCLPSEPQSNECNTLQIGSFFARMIVSLTITTNCFPGHLICANEETRHIFYSFSALGLVVEPSFPTPCMRRSSRPVASTSASAITRRNPPFPWLQSLSLLTSTSPVISLYYFGGIYWTLLMVQSRATFFLPN